MRVQGNALPNDRQSYVLVDASGSVEPVTAYLTHLTNIERSPNTVRAYAYDLKLWFEFLAASGTDWRDASIEIVGSFSSWLRTTRSGAGTTNVVPLHERQAGRSAKTANRALSALFGFYEFHHELGVPLSRQLLEFPASRRSYKEHLGRPTDRRRPIRLRESDVVPKVLSVDEVQRILAACSRARDRLLISFWWLAGLRVGQTLALRHADIDGRRRQIRIVPGRPSSNGARPKVRDEHSLPLRDELVHLHADYMHLEYLQIASDHLFVNLWSQPIGAPMTYSGVDKLVRRLRKRSGVYFTPHMLRHTFATDLHRRGVRLEVISRLLTHRSSETTSNLYLHLDVEDLRSELQRVGVER